jgi:hypothetical protein
MVPESHRIANTMHPNLSYSKAGWLTLAIALFLVIGVGFATTERQVNASDETVVVPVEK